MIAGLFVAMLLQVQPPQPPRAPEPPSLPQSVTCVIKDNIVNAYVVQTCIPGLRRMSLGNALEPEAQPDGTWIHRVPFRSQNGSAFETTICGIDLIDFNFTSPSGAVFNFSRSVNQAEYCTTKGFTVPPGDTTLTVQTRTRSPLLVIRSSVITAPVATLLQPPPAIVVIPVPIFLIPPPPPPPVPVAAPPPPPPPF